VSSLAAQVLPVARVGRNDTFASSTPQDKLNRSRFTRFMRSPSELLPSILRSDDDKEDNDVVAVGWKFQATNRKEREESLRSVYLSAIDLNFLFSFWTFRSQHLDVLVTEMKFTASKPK
jgi:hypothetical protein